MRVGRTIDSPSFKEGVGFSVAELVSMGTSLGVVAVADQVAPDLLKTASKALSKVVFEPYLESIERALGTVCKLEECKVDVNEDRQKRAEKLAHTSIVFGSAWALSMVAKFATRRVMNHAFDIKDKPIAKTGNWFMDKIAFKVLHPDEWKIGAADELVHLGSLITVNTAAAKMTDEMIRTNTSILTKCGIPEKKAHEISSMAMIWELPNFLGLLAGLGVISHKHGHDWGQRNK